MSKVMIKEDFEHEKLLEVGYEYAIMEGGYVSKDAATIVVIDRSPYKRQVMQFRRNAETEHESNVEQLRQIGALE